MADPRYPEPISKLKISGYLGNFWICILRIQTPICMSRGVNSISTVIPESGAGASRFDFCPCVLGDCQLRPPLTRIRQPQLIVYLYKGTACRIRIYFGFPRPYFFIHTSILTLKNKIEFCAPTIKLV